MTKKSMEKVLSEQLNQEVTVKTMVIQDLIWPKYAECRLFTHQGDVFSAIFVDDEKTTEFILCPKEVNK